MYDKQKAKHKKQNKKHKIKEEYAIVKVEYLLFINAFSSADSKPEKPLHSDSKSYWYTSYNVYSIYRFCSRVCTLLYYGKVKNT